MPALRKKSPPSLIQGRPLSPEPVFKGCLWFWSSGGLPGNEGSPWCHLKQRMTEYLATETPGVLMLWVIVCNPETIRNTAGASAGNIIRCL